MAAARVPAIARRARVHAVLAVLLAAACVAGTARAQDLPADSLYQAHAALVDQDGRPIAFEQGRGRPRLVSMFYTSCPYACPVTIETLQQTLARLPPELARRVPVLLVSFDAQHDTPARLKAAAAPRARVHCASSTP